MSLVGHVSDLFVYPVKSMLGERVEASEASDKGLAGDRAYALRDVETGKLVSAKRPRLWGRMFELRAHYESAPDAAAASPIVIRLPDGDSVSSNDPNVDRLLSDALGRKVSLVSTTEDFLTYEEVWVDEKQADPYGPVVGSEGADRLIENTVSLGAPQGTYFDFSAIHLVTTATLAALRKAHPAGDFDVRRFRPNIVVEVAEEGFVEDAWLERTLRIGADEVELNVLIPTPRCVMTTLPQDELPKDSAILRTPAQVNRRLFGPFGEQPCVGVYAEVTAAGRILSGDEVHLD